MFTGPVRFTGQRIKSSDVALTGWQIRMVTHQFQKPPELDAGVPATFNIFEATGRLEIMLYVKHQRIFERRNVNKACVRVIRHRLPVMPAKRPGQHPVALAVQEILVWVLYRTSGFHINMGGPVNGDIRIGPQQFAGLPIQHIEKAIFWRLHNYFTHLAIDFHVGQHHVLHSCVVPAIARRGLVVPAHAASICIHRDDRGQEQIIPAARRANCARPWRAIADT